MNAFYAIILIISFRLVVSSAENLPILVNQINESYPFCTKVCQECRHLLMNCRNLNLSNFKLIKNPLPETEQIIFTGNSISAINGSIFLHDRPSIKSLNLSNNKITSINKNAFENLPSLNELILDKNSINFNNQTEMEFLVKISQSLELLSLSQNLIQDSIHNLNSMGSKLNLFSLKYLNLDQNYLTEFKSDIFCHVPSLVGLNLEANNLSRIDLKTNCVNSLDFLNLKSNRFHKIDKNLLSKFKNQKKLRPKFEVYLSDNPFKCDCNLYEFFKYLKEELGVAQNFRVIKDAQNLRCDHEDSLHYSINRPLMDSNLDTICGYPRITTQQFKTTPDQGPYFTAQNKTQPLSTKRPYQTEHHISRLAVLLFCSLLMSATLILVLKLRLQKLWNIIGFKFYRRLNDQNNSSSFNRLSFDGAGNSLREAENLDPNDCREIRKPRRKINFNFRSLLNLFRKKRNLDYYRFDYQSNDSNMIYRLEDRRSDESKFSLTKSILKFKNKENEKQTDVADVVPIISDDEETTKDIMTGIGVLGARNI
ncbi:slit -like protein [Brachionus plicatilis]|uniref:Slit-like protein n=1 Tax=Brachionus plicatilis TaxID=10195 RepID=A0A3M7QUM8_BRAPC|nr:slit -like protein [Brachionus plicatilis]